ncbi:WD40 repeat domain-containing protein [Streptomyces aureus]
MTCAPRSLTGHTGRMQAMAVAQLDDRPHLVTSDRGGSLQLWDLATGVETRRLADHTEVMAMAVTQLAGQPHLVAVEGVYGSKVAYLWDLTTGRRVRRIASGLRGIVSSVIVTEVKGVPSAFLVSFGDDHRAFDLATGTQTLALSIGTLRAVTAATLAGRQHLVVAHSNDEELEVWDLTRNLINRRRVDMPRTLWFMTGTLTDPEAEFTPQSLATVIVDGRTYTIAGCGDGTVRVWNLATGTLVGTLVGHTDLVNALAVVRLHGRPHVISASLDGTVRVWDLTAMTLVDRGRPVTAALLTHLDGRPHALTTGSPRRAIRAWDISTGTHREVPTWHKHELKTLAMAVLDGRQYAVVGAVDGMSLCDLATGGYSGYLEGHCARVHTIAVADLEGRPHVLSGSDRGSVVVHDLVGEEYRLRDFRDGQDLLLEKFKLVKDGMESVIAVDLARIGGRLYAISGNHRGSVEVWDLTTLTKHSLGFPPGELHLAALAVTDLHNRPHLMTGDRHGPVKVWKLALNSRDVDPVRTLVGHTAAVYAIAPVSLKGRPHALTGSDDQTVRVWDVGAGVCLATLHLPAPCQAIAAGPDGSVVLGVGHEVVALRLTI